ncbi:Vms1/Ankzf1 family peptidyl-tRNA hydrolase [Herbiconiux flava]|uniref:Peptide chain release factor 1 n=1 Tax=Herbiconiux flava TaxID=881268 RepID=A0A852STY0_9MICO|nr:Vms1/Ankzf1 family peptidyl-tRNA hydrolase [Herbiconiux flava]NYD72251.1 hypothetical protein [Herbiconiux flava]GLK17785.1 hypothetical protein GCM10017602_22670 [Herbiconiux flava]
MTLESAALPASVYRASGPWSQVYLDISVDTADPPSVNEERRISATDRLAAAGAPQADVDAVAEAMATADPAGGERCLFVLVHDGEVVVQALLPGRATEPEFVAYRPVPDLVPLLEHRPGDFAHVVVETARDGGEIRLYRLDETEPVVDEEHQGRTDTLHKIRRGGGWRHHRLQNHTEEIWRRTQAELATTIDRVVHEHRPRLLTIAGDIRARQLLEGELSAESRAILTVVPVDTHADGASSEALDEHLDNEIARILADDKKAVLDLLALHEGRGDNRVESTLGGVVHALASAQVETLLIDAERLREHELLALATEPWVAAAPEDALGAEVLDRVPAPVALSRAAVLTDATVLFTDSREAPDAQDDVSGSLPSGVAAVLRWRTGPPVPGEE